MCDVGFGFGAVVPQAYCMAVCVPSSPQKTKVYLHETFSRAGLGEGGGRMLRVEEVGSCQVFVRSSTIRSQL